MPGKMARSDPRPPCGLPEVPITVRTSRLSCRKVGKAPIFTPVREPSGESSRDRVFKAFCDLVAASMRPGDLFGRLGGEEFACLVANATAQALHTAERLRHEFEAMRFPSLEGNATVSIGVAMASEAGRSLPALLAIADRALYRAKADGRNRVAPAPLVLVGIGTGETARRTTERAAAMAAPATG